MVRKLYIVMVLVLAPAIAYGGLFDWLVGGVVKKVAEVSLGFKIVNFLAAFMPLFSILLVAALAVACFWGAVLTMKGFSVSVAIAMKTENRVSGSEWVLLVMTYVPTIAVVLALLWFGGLFAWAASDGMIDIINYTPAENG